MGLRQDLSNQDYANKIEALAKSEQIFPPPEGCFSDLLHCKMLGAIQGLGYECVWVGDEVGTERKLYWIEDLKGKNAEATVGYCNVFTPDRAMLWDDTLG